MKNRDRISIKAMNIRLISIVLSFFSLFPFVINLRAVDANSLKGYSGRFNIIFNELRLSINGNSTEIFLLFFCLVYFIMQLLEMRIYI